MLIPALLGIAQTWRSSRMGKYIGHTMKYYTVMKTNSSFVWEERGESHKNNTEQKIEDTKGR